MKLVLSFLIGCALAVEISLTIFEDKIETVKTYYDHQIEIRDSVNFQNQDSLHLFHQMFGEMHQIVKYSHHLKFCDEFQ